MTKATTEAVARFGPEANGLLNRLLGPAFDEWGMMLRGWVVARRIKNAERALKMAAVQLATSNPPSLSTPAVDLRTIMALLEGASLEDEGSPLEQKWVGLLASAASGRPVTSNYPSILSQMSPTDARLLDEMSRRQEGTTVADLGGSIGVEGAPLLESCDNLLRLRLCAIATPRTGEVIRQAHLALENGSSLDLTTLGRQFLSACGAL